jgi:pyroglutamyl-peptidase
LFYGLMHLAATRRPGLRGGFLHVPYLPSQAAHHANATWGAPSMALDDIVRGIEIVLTVAASRNDDIGDRGRDHGSDQLMERLP